MRILRWGWIRWFSLGVCTLGVLMAGFFASMILVMVVGSGPEMRIGPFLVLVGSLAWLVVGWRSVGRFIRYSRLKERWSLRENSRPPSVDP